MTFATVTLGSLLGLAVGSFCNVCIQRLPQEESVISPRSRCPACRTPLRALDNVPLLSFLWLRGRCRACGAAISCCTPPGYRGMA
ncbi:MAG: prepilin peptidase, partial [candidate division NC10 bacterium]